MTDLERARALMRNSPPTLAKITEALAAARREGEEVAFREGMEQTARIDKAMLDNAQRVGAAWMRERATQRLIELAPVENIHQDCIDAIAALPLTPEKDA